MFVVVSYRTYTNLNSLFLFPVKPLVVQILTKEPRVSPDKNYDVECRTSGSKPEAKITWWKGDKQINKTAQNVSFDKCNLSTAMFANTRIKHTLHCTVNL